MSGVTISAPLPGEGTTPQPVGTAPPAEPSRQPDEQQQATPPAAARFRPPIAWERLTLPLAGLAAAGVSVTLFVQTLVMTARQREDFLIGNALVSTARDALVSTVLGGAGVPLLAAAVALLLGRGRAVPPVERAARMVAALIPACLLPALFNVRFSHQNQLTYLLVLGAFVLMFEPLLRSSLQVLPTMNFWGRLQEEARSLRRLPWPSSRVFFFALVCLASAGYATYVGYYTILNHHRLGTTAFDLGIYDNLMYNALHGRPFVSPVLFGPAGGNYLAGHAEFAMLLFVPFYAIHPGPETMLIIQAVVLGFAAVPLYLFASTRLSRPVAATVAIAYLMFAPLHGPNFYDFHWIPLAVFFHFWLYYAIANRKHWLTAAMVVVLFAIREDVAVGLAVLGMFLLFSGLRPRLGLVLGASSVIWFVIVRFVIMPLAGSWYFQNLYSGLFAEGVSTFGSVIKTIATNPLYTFGTLGSEGKLTYVGHMFIPLALLPCRRVQLLPLAVAGIFFTILTTGYGPMAQISFQYTTHWIPYLFLASVLALMMISREPGGFISRRAALVTMAVAMLAHSYNFGALLQHEAFVGGFSRIEFQMSPEDHRRYRELKELLAMIPPSASVAATEQETAHVSTRKVVYPLRVPPGPVDYLLIGRSHVGELSRASLNAALANRDEYGLLAERGSELFLFKRGHVSAATTSARAMLGVP
ncbi:MAG: DUF2079 domain-containing protein [Polyangia bacterium]